MASLETKRRAVQSVERCLNIPPLAWSNEDTLTVVYRKLKRIGAIDGDNNGQILNVGMSRKAKEILS